MDEDIKATEAKEASVVQNDKDLLRDKRACEIKFDQEMNKNMKLISENNERALELRQKKEDIEAIQEQKDKYQAMIESLSK